MQPVGVCSARIDEPAKRGPVIPSFVRGPQFASETLDVRLPQVGVPSPVQLAVERSIEAHGSGVYDRPWVDAVDISVVVDTAAGCMSPRVPHVRDQVPGRGSDEPAT